MPFFLALALSQLKSLKAVRVARRVGSLFADLGKEGNEMSRKSTNSR